MGNSTSFNLNDQIALWRSQLLARDGISSENVSELETHLRDTITRLTSRELTEEEAFWVATRRLGTPDTLTAEFAKDDPSAKWRVRIFWIAAALLALRVFNYGVNQFYIWLQTLSPKAIFEAERFDFQIQLLSNLRPFLVLTVAMAIGYGLLSGRLQNQVEKLAKLTRSRKWLAALVFVPVLGLAWFDASLLWKDFHYISAHNYPNGVIRSGSWFLGTAGSLAWDTLLGVTVYLLAPGRRAKTAE